MLFCIMYLLSLGYMWMPLIKHKTTLSVKACCHLHLFFVLELKQLVDWQKICKHSDNLFTQLVFQFSLVSASSLNYSLSNADWMAERYQSRNIKTEAV